MNVQELIDKLEAMPNKSVDVILHEPIQNMYYGIIEEDIVIAKDGDVLIEVS